MKKPHMLYEKHACGADGETHSRARSGRFHWVVSKKQPDRVRSFRKQEHLGDVRTNGQFLHDVKRWHTVSTTHFLFRFRSVFEQVFPQ